MGLFDGLRGKTSSANMDVGTAIMVPTVAAMLADGSIEDEEYDQIRAICLLSPIFRRNSRDQDSDIILRAIRFVEDTGPEAMCQRAAQQLSPALRETAFAFAAAMVFSDGHVGRKEEAVIERMTGWLGITEGRAATILSVIAVLQHPANA